MCDKNGISGGEGGSVLRVNFWKIQRGGAVIGKIPSVGGGGYGYFLELHIEFVGSLLCYERFFPWYSGLPLSLKKPTFDLI